MKALTVRQPWAQSIILGRKDVENRNWQTPHRGRIAIHAALAIAPPDDLAYFQTILKCEGDPAELMIENLPRGVILGTVEIYDVVQNHDSIWTMDAPFQWLFRDAIRFDKPIPATGKLGMWTWEEQPA